MHRKNLIIFLSVLVLVSLMTTVAFARAGRTREVTFTETTTDPGGSLLVTNEPSANLGSEDIDIVMQYSSIGLNGTGDVVTGNDVKKLELLAEGVQTLGCINPGGELVPLDAHPKMNATSGQTDPGEAIKGKPGRRAFSLDALGTPSGAECPNPAWLLVLLDIDWESATICGYDNGGAKVFCESFDGNNNNFFNEN